MTARAYSRFELAENQLRTAVRLLVDGGDRFSVISLAGAADVILTRLVSDAGLENFTDFSIRHDVNHGGAATTREIHGRDINNTLFINQIKHLDSDDDTFIDMEPNDCALGAVAKALANYVALPRHEPGMVREFKAWMKVNLDPRTYNVECDPNWKPVADDAQRK